MMKIELTNEEMEGIIHAADICAGEGQGSVVFFRLALEVYKFLHPQGPDPHWMWAVGPKDL